MKKTRGIKYFYMLVIFALLLFSFGNHTEAKTISKINYKKITIIQGKKKKLKVSGISVKKIRWISQNTSIATVSRKGVVQAKKEGKTTIVGKVGKKKFRCKVAVKAKKTVKKTKKKKPKKDLYDVADDKVNAVIQQLFGGHPEKYSEAERAYKIAYWICTNTKYSKKNYREVYDGQTYDLPAWSWTTAIWKGTAKCSGLADIYRYMGEKVDLEFKTCVSYKENHEMNIVKIDGQYYWISLTIHVGGHSKMTSKVFQSKYMRNWDYLKSFSNINLCTSRRFDDLHYKVEHHYYKRIEDNVTEVTKKEFEDEWNKSLPEHRMFTSTEFGQERQFSQTDNTEVSYFELYKETNMYERGDYMNY